MTHILDNQEILFWNQLLEVLMDFIFVLIPMFLFVIVYYIYQLIKHLIELKKLQLKSNELLYEINSGISTLISYSREK